MLNLQCFAFTMPSNLQVYDALPSETGSTSPALCQPENQLRCEKGEPSKKSPKSSLPSRACILQFWQSWEWEFAACFLVLAIPIIISGTLYPHSGQPLPQWPFRVSINSLLSIYALALKAAIGFILTSCIGQLQWAWFSETRPLTDMLRFDSATRGANGALSLIWRQRFRQPLTALGCIIMVLSVAVDPFVQQLVRPVDCSVELLDDNAAATLPRTNVFNDEYKENFSTLQSTERTESLGKVIEGVLYDAIFNPGQDPPWQCSTGNCTFQDTYGTIGMCYSCQDVSEDVIINAACSRPNSSYASQHPTSGSDCPADSDFIVQSNITIGGHVKLGTEMKISSDGVLDPAVFADASADDRTGQIFETGNCELLFGFLVGATANSGGRIDWTTFDTDGLINGIPPDNLACKPDDPKDYWPCQGYGAASCSLGPCVQIYNATISAGVLEEHLVASSSGITWGTILKAGGGILYSALIDTHCPAAMETLSDRDTSVGSRWLQYNISLVEADMERGDNGSILGFRLPNNITSLLDNGCLYLARDFNSIVSIMKYLSGTVENAGGYAYSGPGPGAIVSVQDFQGPEVVRSIYNWGLTDFERVQSVVANISDSLTTYIRTQGGNAANAPIPAGTKPPRNVQGKVYHYATCLQAQWPWLSYPTSLAVSTTLFFLMVVKVTRRQGNSVWKASPLAWVLRVEGPGSEMFPSSQGSCKGMKDRSTQIAVHLFDGDLDGPRIRMADLKDPNLL